MSKKPNHELVVMAEAPLGAEVEIRPLLVHKADWISTSNAVLRRFDQLAALAIQSGNLAVAYKCFEFSAAVMGISPSNPRHAKWMNNVYAKPENRTLGGDSHEWKEDFPILSQEIKPEPDQESDKQPENNSQTVDNEEKNG